MTSVPARELRNHTSDVLGRVKDGESISITVHGEPVAELRPPPDRRRTWLSRDEVRQIVTHDQADPGLRDDLARLADSTDDLGPIQ